MRTRLPERTTEPLDPQNLLVTNTVRLKSNCCNIAVTLNVRAVKTCYGLITTVEVLSANNDQRITGERGPDSKSEEVLRFVFRVLFHPFPHQHPLLDLRIEKTSCCCND